MAPMGHRESMANSGIGVDVLVASGWPGWVRPGWCPRPTQVASGQSQHCTRTGSVQGDFTAETSDHKWVPDITEFACWDAKLFLAGIKDLHDQSIVGWSMGIRQTTDLVINALVMALSRRHPDNDELIHHTDRGSQYTSLEFSTRLADWCINPSYSQSGTCFDNAAMESTWATFKTEIHHIYGSWSEMTRSQLRTALFSYIETFYNRNRHQARLGHRTPADAYAASHAA